MLPVNNDQLLQDSTLRQALLEVLPDLALKNGICQSVTEAMAGRLLSPTLIPEFAPEDDSISDDGDFEEEVTNTSDGSIDESLSDYFEARLESISEQLSQLQEKEDAGQKELAAIRRDFAEFSSAEKNAAADRVLLSVIRVLDSVEAAIHEEDEERIEFLRKQEYMTGSAIAHHYMTELKGVRQDLLDLLYQNDTEPFTCDSNTLDPRRQQVLARKTAAYATDDPGGKLLLESRRPGYTRGDRILRKELVWAIQVQPRWMYEELVNGQHEPPSPL